MDVDVARLGLIEASNRAGETVTTLLNILTDGPTAIDTKVIHASNKH